MNLKELRKLIVEDNKEEGKKTRGKFWTKPDKKQSKKAKKMSKASRKINRK